MTGANAFAVFLASLLGVYGDGSPGALPSILVIGWIWVACFCVGGLYIAVKGNGQRGVDLNVMALPYALLLVILIAGLRALVAGLIG